MTAENWRCEGIGWYAPKTGNAPVYRLYDPNKGDHFFTKNKNEKESLVKQGWRYEGIGWYSGPADGSGRTVPVYRMYNPNAAAGAHFFTKNKNERDFLVEAGWRAEGVSWYGA